MPSITQNWNCEIVRLPCRRQRSISRCFPRRSRKRGTAAGVGAGGKTKSDVFQEEDKLRQKKKTLLQEQERLLSGIQALTLEIRRETSRIQHLCGDITAWEMEENITQVQQAAEMAGKVYAVLEDADSQLFARPLSPL
ncbi:MAG: hypothetical protein ACLRNW_14755 [Neglectibacter sp.]